VEGWSTRSPSAVNGLTSINQLDASIVDVVEAAQETLVIDA